METKSTKLTSMGKPYHELYSSLLESIKKCPSINFEKKWIECRFHTSLTHWEKLKEQLTHNDFENEQEEIAFFKTTKHLFTAEIEYYSLLYFALVFEPPINHHHRIQFWEKESKRLQQLKDKDKEFYQYYKSGEADRDREFFLRKNTDESLLELFKIKEDDRPFSTGFDHIITLNIALERYTRFAEYQLKENHNSSNWDTLL